jgi:hypothetical protein
MLLNIFHTGGVTLALTIFWLGLTSWFLYQASKAHNSGWYQINPTTHEKTEGKDKIPFTQIPQFWFAVAVTVMYIIVMVFVVAPDYKGV